VRESRKVYSPRKGTTVQIQMKMLFQKGHFGVVWMEHLFPVRGSATRPPVPHDLVWVLSLNFLPQIPQETKPQKTFLGLLRKRSSVFASKLAGAADPTCQQSCLSYFFPM
jgi:hypothetical protein